jgi:hypothetical protein
VEPKTVVIELPVEDLDVIRAALSFLSSNIDDYNDALEEGGDAPLPERRVENARNSFDALLTKVDRGF